MTDHVRVTLEDRVLRIALTRPDKKNALTNAMYAALGVALQRAQDDPAVRVVVLEADGDTFTAGNDISDFAAIASGAAGRSDMKANLFLTALAQLQKPCIAAVHGMAVGIGVTMLMHCDLVYVAEDAQLITPFVNLGLVPEAASSMLIPARIGHARAFAMFALGEPVDGRTAAAIGLANAALPAGAVRSKALASAKTLAAKPSGALKATKKLMRNTQAIMELMAREGDLFIERLRTAEAAEALRAFAERRTPDFSSLES